MNIYHKVIVYVDDIIVIQNFSINNLGHLGFFLCIKVSHLTNGVDLTQKKFAQELLNISRIESSNMLLHPYP